MPASINPTIQAIRDNGSAHGIQDVSINGGLLTPVPWRDGYQATTGTLVIGAIGGADNGDGSSSYIQFQTPISPIPSAINNIRHKFYGTTYGIRFDPNFTSGGGGIYDFCVIIDRIAYRVRKALVYDESLLPHDTNVASAMHAVIVARDLPDGIHDAEINVTVQAGVNGQRIYGYLADSKYYRPYPPRSFPGTTTALTTALVTISLSGVPRFRGLGFRSIIYTNFDIVSRIVTLTYQGVPILKKAIAARDTYIFDPLSLLGNNSTAGSIIGEYKQMVDGVTTGSATTLTRVTTTATFTASANHGLSTGDVVTITGSNLSAYNVTNAIITVTSATVFTYVMASDPGGTSAGTPIFTASMQATTIIGS